MGANSYTLSLQLQLADLASAELDTVFGKLQQVESQLEQLSQVSTGLSVAATTLAGDLTNISASVGDLNTSLTSASTTLTADLETWQSVGTIVSQLEKDIQAATDVIQHNRKDWKFITDQITKINKFHALEHKWILEQETHLDRFYKLKYPKIQKLVKEIEEDTKETAEYQSGMQVDLGAAALEIFGMVVGVRAMRAAFATLLKAEEDFVTANYRVYGSIDKVVDNVAEVSMQYSVLPEEARAAYKALADIGVPAAEIAGVAGTLSQMSRVLGVATKDMAEWYEKMKFTGSTTKALGDQLNWMSAAMFKFGFTADEVSKIMRQQSEAAGALSTVYSADQVAQINETGAAFGGLASNILKATSGIKLDPTKFTKWFMDVKTGAAGEAGPALMMLADTKDPVGGLQKALAGMANMNPMFAKLASGAKLTNEEMYAAGMTMKQFGIDDFETFRAMALAHGKFGKSLDAMRGAINGAQDDIKSITATQRAYEDATNGIARSWEQAKGAFEAAYHHLMALIAPVLIWVNGLLESMGHALHFVLGGFKSFSVGKESYGFLQFLKDLGVGLLVLAGVAVSTYFAWEFVKVGIKKVGDAIKSFPAGKMALIGLTFMEFGAAALMFGVAVKLIADAGDMGVVAMFGLAAAFAVVVGGLVVLAGVGDIAVPVMMALAGVFLAMGAAAIMFAAAINISVDAVTKLMDHVSLSAAAGLLAFGLAFGVMAAAVAAGAAILVLASPLILAAGVVLSGLFVLLAFWQSTIDSAAESLKKFGDALVEVAGAVPAITSLRAAFSGIVDVADDFNDAAAGLATSVSSIAVSLFELWVFRGAIAGVTAMFSRLGGAAGEAADGVADLVLALDDLVDLSDDLADFLDLSDGFARFTDSVNESSQSLLALLATVSPMGAVLSKLGLDMAGAKAITTVKVMNEDSYAGTLQHRQELLERKKHTELLKRIAASTENIEGGVDDSGELKKIRELLEEYVATGAESRLATAFTNWQR